MQNKKLRTVYGNNSAYIVYNNIHKYCDNADISIRRFERICCLGNGTVGKLRNGKRGPNIQTLLKMETYTGIPIVQWLDWRTL